jgi:hypothetical protein
MFVVVFVVVFAVFTFVFVLFYFVGLRRSMIFETWDWEIYSPLPLLYCFLGFVVADPDGLNYRLELHSREQKHA